MINEQEITRNLLSKGVSEEKAQQVVLELQKREKGFLDKSKESFKSQVGEHGVVGFGGRRFAEGVQDFTEGPKQVAQGDILEGLKTSAKGVGKTGEGILNVVGGTVGELFNQAMLAVGESTIKPGLKQLDAKTLSKLGNLTQKPIQSIGEASEVVGKELEKVPEHIRKDIESGLNLIGFKLGKGLLKKGPVQNIAKNKFNTSKLKKIGEGTDRKVFDLGDGRVVKIAKNKRGLEQNKGALNKKLQDSGVIPKVHEIGDDFIVMDKVKTFNQLSKAEQSKIAKFSTDIHNAIRTEKKVSDLQAILKKNGWDEVAKLDHKTFGWGDIQPKNLSVVNGKITLLDEGTVTLVNSLNKYFARNVVKSLGVGGVIGTIEGLRQGGKFDPKTLYQIGDYLVGGDILNSNTDKENENIFIHNLAPKG